MINIDKGAGKQEQQSYRSKSIYLVTGATGFIGSHFAKQLLYQDCRVIGIDNMNVYYDVNLKYSRLNNLQPYEHFTFRVMRGNLHVPCGEGKKLEIISNA